MSFSPAPSAQGEPVRMDRWTIWLTTALGFSSGLPYVLLIGSIVNWMTNAQINYSTIGILSWVGLLYAFKFLWSPLLEGVRLPFGKAIGHRRAWVLVCQGAIALCLFAIAQTDPRTNIVLFGSLALIAAFFSASQDVVLDAWRIEIAGPERPIDRLATHFQAGYRFSSFIGQAFGLLVADWLATPGDPAAGWPQIFGWMGVLMIVAMGAILMAPDPVFAPREHVEHDRSTQQSTDMRKLRSGAALVVTLGWILSGLTVLAFFFITLQPDAKMSASAFRDESMKYILAVTVGLPLVLSFLLARKPGALDTSVKDTALDVLFDRVLAPMADLVKRYWLWALLILLLVMTYRISDSIWGSFSTPFYLNILGHTNSDVAVASKTFGVLMTIAGIVLGGFMLAWIGRILTLAIGGILAAVTNLLYVDLAAGGAHTDAFLRASGLGPAIDWLLRTFVGLVQGTGAHAFDKVMLGPELNRLTAVISAENMAGGVSSVAYVAWLSSIVNKQYAAVQYALLSSLAFLVAVLPRPMIGKYVDAVKDQGIEAQAHRFSDVFVVAMWLGLAAVALVLVEWYRSLKEPKPDQPVGS